MQHLKKTPSTKSLKGFSNEVFQQSPGVPMNQWESAKQLEPQWVHTERTPTSTGNLHTSSIVSRNFHPRIDFKAPTVQQVRQHVMFLVVFLRCFPWHGPSDGQKVAGQDQIDLLLWIRRRQDNNNNDNNNNNNYNYYYYYYYYYHHNHNNNMLIMQKLKTSSTR